MILFFYDMCRAHMHLKQYSPLAEVYEEAITKNLVFQITKVGTSICCVNYVVSSVIPITVEFMNQSNNVVQDYVMSCLDPNKKYVIVSNFGAHVLPSEHPRRLYAHLNQILAMIMSINRVYINQLLQP